MLYCFIIIIHFKECLPKKEVAFHQIRIHVKSSTTILTWCLPSFHLEMTKGPIGEVGRHAGIFNLQLLTLNVDSELNLLSMD
jgi:hypothetical protein